MNGYNIDNKVKLQGKTVILLKKFVDLHNKELIKYTRLIQKNKGIQLMLNKKESINSIKLNKLKHKESLLNNKLNTIKLNLDKRKQEYNINNTKLRKLLLTRKTLQTSIINTKLTLKQIKSLSYFQKLCRMKLFIRFVKSNKFQQMFNKLVELITKNKVNELDPTYDMNIKKLSLPLKNMLLDKHNKLLGYTFVKKLHHKFEIKFTGEKLLSSFMIFGFPSEILDIKPSLLQKNTVQNDLFELSKEVIDLIKNINNKESVRKLIVGITKFNNCFNLFIKHDKVNKIQLGIKHWLSNENIIEEFETLRIEYLNKVFSIYNLYSHELDNIFESLHKFDYEKHQLLMNKLKQNKVIGLFGKTLMNTKEKLIVKKFNEYSIIVKDRFDISKKIIKNIKLYDNKFDTNNLKFIKSTNDKLKLNIEKSYWDLFKQDLDNKNYESFYKLLNEIKKDLKRMKPIDNNYIDKLDEYINIDTIKKQQVYFNRFINLMTFIMNEINIRQSIQHSKESNEKWSLLLDSLKDDLNNKIVEVMKFVMHEIKDLKEYIIGLETIKNL